MFEVSALQNIVNVASAFMRSDFAAMQLYDPNRKALKLICHKGFDPQSAAKLNWVYSNTPTTCGRSLRLRQQVSVADVIADTPSMRDTYLACGIRAAQTTPLLNGSKLLGTVSTHWRTPAQLTERKLRVFALWAEQTARSLARWGRTLQLLREAEAQVQWSKSLIAESEELIRMLNAKRSG